MATVSITISDKLDTDAKAALGGNQPMKDYLKNELRRAVLNAKLRRLEADNAAALEAARQAILAAGDEY
jgi:hypothetical protein